MPITDNELRFWVCLVCGEGLLPLLSQVVISPSLYPTPFPSWLLRPRVSGFLVGILVRVRAGVCEEILLEFVWGDDFLLPHTAVISASYCSLSVARGYGVLLLMLPGCAELTESVCLVEAVVKMHEALVACGIGPECFLRCKVCPPSSFDSRTGQAVNLGRRTKAYFC